MNFSGFKVIGKSMLFIVTVKDSGKWNKELLTMCAYAIAQVNQNKLCDVV